MGFLLFSAVVVFQSCVCCFGGPSCLRDVPSRVAVNAPVSFCLFLLNDTSCESPGFCFRIAFLLSMPALMFSERSLCLFRILPWGILCLSAVSIQFVSILFPWCASVGSGVFVLFLL